jgi:protein TonB
MDAEILIKFPQSRVKSSVNPEALMTDSTARATRFESDPAPAPAFLWAPPQKPVTVSIPLALIDRLEKEAVESFRSLSSRGSEIGGLLFGTFQPGAPLAVTIETYEAIDCEYARGPLYRLTDVELARLDKILEQRLASGIRAVGFYRSHTRKGLGLDTDDLALLDSRFRETHQIALLVRPNATKASMAGIFFREDGKIQSEASCLEFPFRSGQHEPPKRDGGLYDGAVAGPRSVAAAPAAAARPVIRAQIVPIASRREVVAETPLPAPVAAVPEPPVAAPEPVVESPKPEPVIVAKPEPEPVVAAKPAPPKPKPEPAPEPKAPVVEPEPAPAVYAEEPARRGNKLLWIVLGSAATVVLASGLLFTSGILHLGSKNAINAPQDTSALALRVERNGGDIVLTWNRDSAAIKNATKAMLSISDGPQQENVQMDLAQLRNGSIVYAPVTSDVVFKMEVTGADQMKTTSESVRVLRTRPSPMGDPNAQQAATPAAPGTPQSAAPKPADPAPADPSTPEPEEKVKLAQAVKPFQKESLAGRLRASAPAEAADAPMLGAPVPSATPAPNVNLGGLSAAPPPAPAPAQSAPAASAKPQVGGQVQQAQLLRRRDPEFPKLARDSGAGGMVELLATILPDGRVGDVKVVKGHPLLRNSAVDAVKTWLYKPAVLNGHAIESQTSIYLNFKSER